MLSKVFLLVCSISLLRADVTIATWNVKDCFYTADVNRRKSDFEKFFGETNSDIIALQEVCSCSDIELIARHMNFPSPHIAISDFVDENEPRNKFEVAIISNYPFDGVSEIDMFPDELGSELSDYDLDTPVNGITPRKSSRGALIVTIPKLSLTIYGIHLKSSFRAVGTRDLDNAEKREYISAILLEEIGKRETSDPNLVHLVLGDMNVGHSDISKIGVDLEVDDIAPLSSGNDGYDDTHCLFESGVMSGFPMENLASHIKTSTYPTFPGTPIDNIYTLADEAAKFSPAYKASRTCGSDHLAVLTNIYELIIFALIKNISLTNTSNGGPGPKIIA